MLRCVMEEFDKSLKRAAFASLIKKKTTNVCEVRMLHCDICDLDKS